MFNLYPCKILSNSVLSKSFFFLTETEKEIFHHVMGHQEKYFVLCTTISVNKYLNTTKTDCNRVILGNLGSWFSLCHIILTKLDEKEKTTYSQGFWGFRWKQNWRLKIYLGKSQVFERNLSRWRPDMHAEYWVAPNNIWII